MGSSPLQVHTYPAADSGEEPEAESSETGGSRTDRRSEAKDAAMLPPGVVSWQEGAGGSLPFSRDLCRCYQLQERHGTALGSQVRAVKSEILVFFLQKQTLTVKKK